MTITIKRSTHRLTAPELKAPRSRAGRSDRKLLEGRQSLASIAGASAGTFDVEHKSAFVRARLGWRTRGPTEVDQCRVDSRVRTRGRSKTRGRPRSHELRRPGILQIDQFTGAASRIGRPPRRRGATRFSPPGLRAAQSPHARARVAPDHAASSLRRWPAWTAPARKTKSAASALPRYRGGDLASAARIRGLKRPCGSADTDSHHGLAPDLVRAVGDSSAGSAGGSLLPLFTDVLAAIGELAQKAL